MVNPTYDDAATAAHLHSLFEGARYVIVPSAIDEAAAAAIRERLERAPTTAFYIADRGRYHVVEFVDDAACDALQAFGERVMRTRLVRRSATWLRFGHGDYQLTHGDALARAAGKYVELVADFSATSTDRADLVYSDGGPGFTVPQWPASVVLVERSERLYRYVRYLDHRVGDAFVWRLQLTFDVAP